MYGVYKFTGNFQGMIHHVINEKVSNVLDDRKEEVVMTSFFEKKSSTKDVDKGTDKLVDMLLMNNKSSTNDVYKGTN